MTFGQDLAKFAQKANDNMDIVVRTITLELAAAVVERTPVGNPELWAANSRSAYGRATHNLFVDRFNEDLAAQPSNLSEGGRTKAKRLGKRKLAETYSYKAPAGYVGGRLRANWQFAAGSPLTTQLDTTDHAGVLTKIAAAVDATAAGGITWLSNNLPYAVPVEFEGHSGQAPAGMVRISVVEAQQHVNKAMAALK